MTAPQTGTSKTLIVLVVALVTVITIAGVFAALYFGYLNNILRTSEHGQSGGGQMISITGNYQSQSISLDRNATVSVTGSYDSINLTLAPHVTVSLDITGNFNHISSRDGYENVTITGNSNTVNLYDSILVGRNVSGNNNIIYRAGSSFVHFTLVMSLNGYNDSRTQGFPWPKMNVTLGESVTIHVVNDDSVQAHGFAIAHYFDSGVTLRPGESYDMTFIADQLGTFNVYCNIVCTVHVYMQSGRLNVNLS